MMGEAHQLVILFPRTHTAVFHARISLQHAKTIISEGGAVSDQLRPRYEALCLREAVKTTPGRLRSKVREIAQRLHPRSTNERHQSAAAQRTVWVTPLPDGMAEIGAVLPAVLAYGIKDRVDRIAKAVRRRAVQISRDQHEASREAAADTQPPTSPTLHPRTRLPLDFDSLRPEAQQRARATVQVIRDTEAVWSLDTYRADAFAELLLNGDPSANAPGTGATPNVQANISLAGAARCRWAVVLEEPPQRGLHRSSRTEIPSEVGRETRPAPRPGFGRRSPFRSFVHRGANPRVRDT